MGGRIHILSVIQNKFRIGLGNCFFGILIFRTDTVCRFSMSLPGATVVKHHVFGILESFAGVNSDLICMAWSLRSMLERLDLKNIEETKLINKCLASVTPRLPLFNT